MIDFDNAATAGRRPAEVVEAMIRALTELAANPGRSAHRTSIEAARSVEETRSAVASLFGVGDPAHVAFTKNATEALNLALLGTLREGDVVLASSFEHNAVMRPLRWLETSRGVRVELIPAGEGCGADLRWLEERLGRGPVRMVAVLAASNVTGEVMPVARIGGLCRRAGAFFLVDAAQGAGVVPLHLERDGIDALAITGHKSLHGPPGTGALLMRDPGAIAPLLRGGTGSRSDAEEQPDFAPDRFEAGTANVPALAGLGVALRILQETELDAIRERHRFLLVRLLAGLRGIPGVRVHGPCDPERQLATVSFTVDRVAVDAVARGLALRDVACRAGLQCAPRAHRTLGTFPGGTVRWSLSTWNTEGEIDAACEALRGIARS